MSSAPDRARLRALLGAILLAAPAACSGSGGTAEPPPPGDRAVYDGARMEIDRVIDGDTAILEDGTSVRYIGIDTPEASPPAQCGAAEATEANEALVEGKTVTLELDPAETRDRFDRLLAYLHVDGTNVNVELARLGRACAFPFGATRLYRDEIAAAESEARAADRGVWGTCAPIPDGCPPVEDGALATPP